jgi:hypothetical protein
LAAVLDWRLTAFTPTDPGPLPWLPGIPPHSMTIPFGASTWQGDPCWSPTSPTRFTITPTKVTPGRSGLQWDATQAQHSSARSESGGPPTALTPKTRDQPEAPNSKRSRPCGNNTSTGISRVPPSPQQMPGPTSHRPHAPHPAATTASSASTRPPNADPAGRPRPADNTPAVVSQRSEHQYALHAAMAAQGGTSPNWLFSDPEAGYADQPRVSSLRSGPRRLHQICRQQGFGEPKQVPRLKPRRSKSPWRVVTGGL